MITAYFDDSGTHSEDGLLVIAGLWGLQNQWEYLEQEWRKVLAEPCPGRGPLDRFHMAHCQISSEKSQFRGWRRVETDYVTRRFTDIISKSSVYGYCVGVSQKDWDENIQGRKRRYQGDAEHYAAAKCMIMIQAMTSNLMRHESQLIFMFDPRIERAKLYEGLFAFLKDNDDRERKNILRPFHTQLHSFSFGSSKENVPLQAADIVAWEMYQSMSDAISGQNDRPIRDNLKRLIRTKRIFAEFADAKTLREAGTFDFDDKFYDEAPAWFDKFWPADGFQKKSRPAPRERSLACQVQNRIRERR
ncbi:DUF3800 domain-containing protein [Aestuariivirga sp.]|uniref:DUF3800 domain-containing protein n=1 Tax=Aestuariivirga sp. TaxID=2650926 RepID=UPI0039E3461D